VNEARAPLLLIAITNDAERLRGGLMLAAAEAALGGTVRIFLQLDAVALLRAPISAPRDSIHAAAGLPNLAVLLDDALELGVGITMCQSGLSLTGMRADEMDPRITVGGAVGILAAGCVQERLAIL
jgi:predicted peroxiredoxin